ncbi:MAG: tetratricopeptide repeat protein [Candidatus Paceibacterota bacterium]|nr:MAG: tetratricopeptide repeat protein [Candidatus Paceibacterota bacterium]
MVIIILIGIALLACAGIAWVISRKIPYLKKLDPELHEEEHETWFHAMFPEAIRLVHAIRAIPLRAILTHELEKIMRAFRVAVMRLDTLSTRTISTLRTMRAPGVTQGHLSTDPVAPENEEEKVAVEEPAVVQPVIDAAAVRREELITREQELIIAIARAPKNVELYEQIGMVYKELEQLQDAREAFEAGLKLDPAHAGLRAQLESLEQGNTN